jgi:pyruvate/2-oxoglutarate dehydrogenase complex dihydrolipoamide acyltransferase (E2) component
MAKSCILAHPEETVPVYHVLALIEEAVSDSVSAGHDPVDTEPKNRTLGPSHQATMGGPQRVSPRSRRLAAEHRVDPQTARGTGQNGQIDERDILRAAAERNRPEAASVQPPPAVGIKDEFLPLSSMRRLIARRMHESLRDTAHHASSAAN